MISAIPIRSRAVGAAVSMLLPAALAFPAHASAVAAQQICGDWVQVDPPAGATLAFTDVEARSASDAFALDATWGLARWDGTAWDPFPIADLFGDYPIVWIDQIGLAGSAHLFLAGRGSNGPFSTDQLLKLWDGTSWSDWHSLTLQPQIGGAPRNGAANAVVGVASDDVWLIGQASGMGVGIGDLPLTVHWDGSQLTEFLTPGTGDARNHLYDAAAIATDDIWAVGVYRNLTHTPLGFHGATYHWDGSSWSSIPNPTDATSSSIVRLDAVTAIASDDVWAAGSNGNQPLFMHWDGTEWTIVPSPATTGTIQALAAIASDDVWAVDYPAQLPEVGKYYHWDGVAWSIVTPPAIPGATSVNRHGALAAVGDCDVWAVGSIDTGAGLGGFFERLQTQDGGGPDNYCVTSPNSAGAGAVMDSVGSVSIAADTFTLVANGAPPFMNGVFFYGPNQLQAPFGDGFLCVGGSIQRLQVEMADAAGHVQHALDFSLPPVGSGPNAILPGSTWNFQFWYRDPAALGAGFNLSDGLSVHFLQ